MQTNIDLSRSVVARIGLLVIGLIGFIIFIVAMEFGDAASDDGRSLRWRRFDVVIDNMDTADNRFDVSEQYELYIEEGPFRFGFAEIPMERLEDISNASVVQDGTGLSPGCSEQPGTFCARQEEDFYVIDYYFRDRVRTGQTVDIDINYTVTGALRSYEEGDQLYWVAISDEREFPIDDALVTVVLPEGIAPERTASYPEEDGWRETVNGNMITWAAPGELEPDDLVEVRVEYPHNERMEEPDWQAGYDRARFYEENIEPLVSILLLALTVLGTIAGLFWMYIRFQRTGRDPEALTVPEYLEEPPSDELPGVVGVLVDEFADMPDVMASLVDLGRRGYLVIEQKAESGLDNFIFHRTEKPTDDLPLYEQMLMRGIFGGFQMSKQAVHLSSLKEKFYTNIPGIKSAMDKEAVARGYFTRSPNNVRSAWMWGGLAALVIAGVFFYLSLIGLTFISPFIVAPWVGLGIVGAAVFIMSGYMPAKTPRGAQEAAKWHAFENYLRNIERFAQEKELTDDIIERFLPYAIVFGIERRWLKWAEGVMTAVPGWYRPTYAPFPTRGYYGRPYVYGRPGQTQDTSGRGQEAGRPSGSGGPLGDLSKSMSGGLAGMSAGLTQMLNDSSRALTSRPQSKSSGSGGWSGGGFSGGGGSGGGSRGFG